METTATARAERPFNVEQNLIARQVFGQRLASRSRVRRRDVGSRMARLGARDVVVEVLQAERELVRIEALGSASKLGALKLLDDQLEAFDLAVPMLDA